MDAGSSKNNVGKEKGREPSSLFGHPTGSDAVTLRGERLWADVVEPTPTSSFPPVDAAGGSSRGHQTQSEAPSRKQKGVATNVPS